MAQNSWAFGVTKKEIQRNESRQNIKKSFVISWVLIASDKMFEKMFSVQRLD